MSRLDSVIRRLQAQRACLDAALALARGVDGPILELGLGNGRTYDHLREHAPDREIFVFDRRIAAHPDCIPDEAHFVEGDVTETLETALKRLPGAAAIAHCDIGTGERAANAALAAEIAPKLADLMAPGGIVVSDQEMNQPGWEVLALPEGVAPGRYNMRRVTG